MKLTKEEKKIREVLIKTAQRKIKTHRPGLISYSELWKRISKKPWGQGCKTPIVNWISRITSFELSNGRPPLNELVVKKGTDRPGEPWENIKNYHEKMLKIEVSYESHEEAQEECWRYWQLNKQPEEPSVDPEACAEEGLKQDRTVTFRKRNLALIKERKLMDDFTCQVCGLKININESYIIDCHHTNPLSLNDKVRVTRISQLVCLCPTCHRIAHTRKPPFAVREMKKILEKA